MYKKNVINHLSMPCEYDPWNVIALLFYCYGYRTVLYSLVVLEDNVTFYPFSINYPFADISVIYAEMAFQ